MAVDRLRDPVFQLDLAGFSGHFPPLSHPSRPRIRLSKPALNSACGLRNSMHHPGNAGFMAVRAAIAKARAFHGET